MPIRKVKGGYKVANTNSKKPMTKRGAKRQLRAIKANQSKKKGSSAYKTKKKKGCGCGKR